MPTKSSREIIISNKDEINKIHATYVTGAIFNPINGVMRISFCEFDFHTNSAIVRTAVVMTYEDAIALKEGLDKVLGQLMPAGGRSMVN